MLTSNDFSQMYPISVLPRRYNRLIEEVDKKGVIYFLKGNKPRVGFISLEYLENLKQKIRKELELERKKEEACQRIQRGMKEYREGKLKAVNSVKDML